LPLITPPPRRPRLWHAWTPIQLSIFAALLVVADAFWRLALYQLIQDAFATVIAASFLAVVLPCLVLARWHGETLSGAFELRPRSRAVIGGVAAGLLGWAPAGLLADWSATLRPPTPEQLELLEAQLPTGTAGIVTAALAAVIVAPFAEELLFRGLFFRLARDQWGFAGGAVLTALFFGVLHDQPWSLFGLVGLGLLFACLYQWTGSLVAPFAAHAAHNAVTLVVLLRLDGDLEAEVLTGPAGWALLAASAALLAWLLVWLRRRGPVPAAATPGGDRG